MWGFHSHSVNIPYCCILPKPPPHSPNKAERNESQLHSNLWPVFSNLLGLRFLLINKWKSVLLWHHAIGCSQATLCARVGLMVLECVPHVFQDPHISPHARPIFYSSTSNPVLLASEVRSATLVVVLIGILHAGWHSLCQCKYTGEFEQKEAVFNLDSPVTIYNRSGVWHFPIGDQGNTFYQL